jgi:hypothetical protein
MIPVASSNGAGVALVSVVALAKVADTLPVKPTLLRAFGGLARRVLGEEEVKEEERERDECERTWHWLRKQQTAARPFNNLCGRSRAGKNNMEIICEKSEIHDEIGRKLCSTPLDIHHCLSLLKSSTNVQRVWMTALPTSKR